MGKFKALSEFPRSAVGEGARALTDGAAATDGGRACACPPLVTRGERNPRRRGHYRRKCSWS